jgi:hypothetical protein
MRGNASIAPKPASGRIYTGVGLSLTGAQFVTMPRALVMFRELPPVIVPFLAPSGHNYANFQQTFPDGLIALFRNNSERR